VRECLTFTKAVIWRSGVIVVAALYGLLQLVYNYIAWFVPPEDQPKFQLIKLLTWRVWVVATPVLTVALIALIIRAAFQLRKQQGIRHRTEVEKLKADARTGVEKLKADARTEVEKLKADAATLRADLEAERAKNLRPELIGEIEDYAMSGPYPHHGMVRQLQVILKVNFVNVRPVPTPIRNFRLTMDIDGSLHTALFAEESDLCRDVSNGQEYAKVRNLATLINSTASQGANLDGYLEFFVGQVPMSMEGPVARKLTLIVTDGFGGEHEIYLAPPSVRPSQRGIASKVFRCDAVCRA
jgi:hypothetical protein